MHRSTPADTLHRSYDSGGARTCIDKVDDSKMMQEMAGNFMKGEVRKEIESPQNYGFSSVVMPATKDKDGQMQDCAEGFISFIGGNRSFPVCAIMDDRRHRPRQLPAGASAQYGPNTDYGRALTYIKPTPQDSSSSGGGGASAQTTDAGGSSGGGSSEDYGVFSIATHPKEFVSMRHIQQKKQPKPQSQGQQGQQGGGGGASAQTTDTGSSGSGSSSSGQDQYNHEKGDGVNTEVRCTKTRIEFRIADNVVGYYDKDNSRWSFTGEMRLGDDNASDPIYGVNNGKGQTTKMQGSGAVLVTAPNPGPPTSLDNMPLEAIYQKIAALEARVVELEARHA